jgi:hypothetical protein
MGDFWRLGSAGGKSVDLRRWLRATQLYAVIEESVEHGLQVCGLAADRRNRRQQMQLMVF